MWSTTFEVIFKNLKWYSLFQQTILLKTFKGCLPQILLDPFSNNLPHLFRLQRIQRFYEIKILLEKTMISCQLAHLWHIWNYFFRTLILFATEKILVAEYAKKKKKSYMQLSYICYTIYGVISLPQPWQN